MLFPAQTDDDSGIAESKAREMHKHKTTNISFVPLAMPSTAGPGTIAMIISWVSTVNEDVYFAPWITAPALVFLTISVIVWIALRNSGAIMYVVGASGIEAISRLMGFLLVCYGRSVRY